MSKRKIRVGSRDSKLAVLQTQMIIEAIAEKNPNMEFELVTMKTTGDMITDRTLEKSGGKGLFVKELDSALLEREVDITVHSLKDVPMEVDDRLPLLAYFKRGNPYDALVLPETEANRASEVSLTSYFAENTKPIGSSSKRRCMQMAEIIRNVELEPVRGNVITRLKKLDGGSYSALILAGAGLERLGLQGRISRLFDEETMIPAAGQGILAVQGRRGENYDYLKLIDDHRTRLEAAAERTFVKGLSGDCSSPIGCRAKIEEAEEGGRIKMWGFHAESDSDGGEKVFCEERFETEKDIIDIAETLVKKIKRKRGKVYLVGAGPGDIGLLTLRAEELLEEADVIVFDRLIGDSILGRVSGGAELIDVGKSAGKHKVGQDEINQILLREALAGKNVVRLKGGDPFVFGRGGEELELLCENGVEFEIVPGITSAVAVAAYNGIPVTHRKYSSSFHVITAHKKEGCETEIDYASLVKLNSTLIFLMGLNSVGRICEGLLAAGMDEATPAAVLSKGTTAGQSRLVAAIGNLEEELKNRRFESPAIIVVGAVCELAEKFAWAEHKPLWGRKIAVMRPKDRNSSLAVNLRKLGAETVEMPVITTEVIGTPPEFRKKVNEIRGAGTIVFTSPFGVKVFFEKMIEQEMDIRSLADTEFAAIGSATKKEIEDRGIFVDIVPNDYSAKSLGELLVQKSKDKKKKILIPRAEQGSNDLIEPLKKADIEFVDMAIYHTQEIFENQVSVYDDSFDLAAFTSASSVKAFCKANESSETGMITAVCIGEKTAQEAKRAGMNVFTAESATIDSLIEKIMEVCGC